MGIHQLFSIIVSNMGSQYNGKPISNIGKELNLNTLKGNRICVDASGFIYSSILAMNKIDALTDSEGNTTSHINTIFNKVLLINAAEIQQVWVFDSPKLNPLKEIELQKRRAKAAASNDPRVQFKMTSKHIADVKKLLALMGVTTMEAPTGIEAEQYCAWLTQKDETGPAFCQYALSNDSDVLAFGGNLLRSIKVKSSGGKTSKTIYYSYEIATIMHETNLNKKQFITMCVAMGTDFNEKTPRVGVKTVMKNVIADKIVLTNEQQASFNYFSKEINSDSFAEPIYGEYSKIDLLNFLESLNFNRDRILKRLENYSI